MLKNGATMAVPFGRVTDNALLGNIGPDIPIHFTPVGHVNTDIKQKLSRMGLILQRFKLLWKWK